MGTRRKSRELVLQMLFQADMGKQTPDACPQDVLGRAHAMSKTKCAALPTICFAWPATGWTEIDGLIGKHTQHWRMDRMATVDRNVLRERWRNFWGIRRRRARW